MISTLFVVKLVLVVCMNSDCSQENAYVADSYRGHEFMDLMDDCRIRRDSGNAAYAKLPGIGARLHCWTPAEITAQGFDQ